jgi:hypothetical protein
VQLTEAQLEVLENALVANEAAVAAANGSDHTESVVGRIIRRVLLMRFLAAKVVVAARSNN